MTAEPDAEGAEVDDEDEDEPFDFEMVAPVDQKATSGSSNILDPNVTPAPSSSVSTIMPFSKNVAAGIGVFVGVLAFGVQNINPGVSGAELLRIAERESIPMAQAACQDKPIVVDFYAPWCENCREVAPVLRQLEGAYGKDINFITVDGSDPRNEDLVGRFHVDGIPHLAFLDSRGALQTSLIGAVPKPILREELEALAQDRPLPYLGPRSSSGGGNGKGNDNWGNHLERESPIDLERGVCALLPQNMMSYRGD
jgi:thiol-disulfide isomerase/thioredoxin